MKSSIKTKIPELRFPEFEGDWDLVQLNNLLDFKNGINAKKEDYGSGYKFINVLDIIKNDFITHDKIRGAVNVSEAVFKKNIVEYGDILFQRSSETREEVGQSNVYLDKTNKATFGGFVIRGKKIAKYNPFFLHLLLKSSTARKEITSKAGGSTRYNVGQDILSSVKLFIGPLPEQQKIASFLSQVDRKIDLLQQKALALETYKKGVIQQLFSQQLRFKQDDGSDFPDWEEKEFNELLKTIPTKKHQIKSSSIKLSGKYKVVNQSEINYVGYYDDESILFKNSPVIIFGDHTTFLKFVDFNFIIGADGTKILKNKKKDVLKYLYYYLSHNNIIPEGYKRHYSILKRLTIKKPHVNEQTKIANFLSSIDQKIEHTQQQLEQTQSFKKGLLQKMFV